MKHTRLFFSLLLSFLLSLGTQTSIAQMVATDQPFDNGAVITTNADDPQADPGDGPPDVGCGPDNVCPIDDGLIVLIAVGIGLAGLRFYRQKFAV